MSYILEALKKSEQDRGHGSIPGVQTIHSSSINYQQNSRPLWPWLVAVMILINIMVLLYLFVLKSPAELSQQQVFDSPDIKQNNITSTRTSTVAADPAPVITNADETKPKNTDRDKKLSIERQPETETIVSFEAVEPVNEIISETVNDSNEVLDIYQLPMDIQQQIPEMAFSAHVYSSNPQQRSLVINGRFMEEGEQLNDDLTLSEITSGGAIFTFRGYRYHTSVLAGWN